MNNKKQIKYFGELVELPNGMFKAKKMQKLVGVNQFKRTWLKCNSRDVAREINRKGLVIK